MNYSTSLKIFHIVVLNCVWSYRKTKGFGVKGFKIFKTKMDKGHKNQFHELIQRTQNGGEPLIPINEIINVTKASFAAIESMKTKKWIDV